MSVVSVPKVKPKRSGFKGLITSVQVGKTKGLNSYDKLRAEKVFTWLDKYAGDDMKFEVQEKIDEKFSKAEKVALLKLKNILEEKEYSEEKELFNRFYEICEGGDLTNVEFFDAAYRAIIKKTKGPRLASLIISIGQKKIVKLLSTLKK